MSKREIKAEETEEAAVRSMKNYLKNLKEQVNQLVKLGCEYEQCSSSDWRYRTIGRILRDIRKTKPLKNPHYMDNNSVQTLRHCIQAPTVSL